MDYPLLKEYYTVHSYETDANLKASLTSLANYIQDIAGKHATILKVGFEEFADRNLFWVLSRMRITIREYPGWNDRILIETWPAGISKLFANRGFRILDRDNRVIGEAYTSWLVMDRETRRLQKPDFLRELIPSMHGPAEEKELPKIPEPEEGKEHHAFTVKFSDLDQNNHVNNVKYILWFLDSFPPDYSRRFQPETIEINYLSELSAGEEVVVRNQAVDNNGQTWLLLLTRKGDGHSICRGRLTWRRNEPSSRLQKE